MPIESILAEFFNVNNSIAIVILIALIWFIKKTMQSQEKRENILMSHNEKYQEVLEQYRGVLEKQSYLIEKQSDTISDIAKIVDRLKTEVENVRNQINQLWQKIS